MKTHITNIYGANASLKYTRCIKTTAEAGHKLGFYECGIYQYNVASDSDSELDKRTDGIIAGIEKGDLVFFQLPTGNGERFDRLLSQKFRTYGAHLIYIIHSDPTYQDYYFLNYSDQIIASNQIILDHLATKAVSHPNSLVFDLSHVSYKLDEIASPYSCLESMQSTENTIIEDDTVHVCFGLQDRSGYYSSFVAATIASVSQWSSRNICFHIIMDDSVSEQNKRYLAQTADRYGNIVSFHSINAQSLKNDNPTMEMYSIGSLFRLLIPKIFTDMKRMIYLDADLLFYKKDIGELWDLDLKDNALAAVVDEGLQKGYIAYAVSNGEVKRSEYFNSGLLVLNLDVIREIGELDVMVMDYINTHKNTDLPDQDGLNVLFTGKTLFLDPSWNTFVRFERHRNTQLTPKVYHYVGMRYVTFAQLTDYDKEYLNIRKDLPWGSDRVVEDLEYGLFCAYNHVTSLQKFVSVTAGQTKKFIFYGYNISGMPSICQMLNLKESDYFIQSDSEDKNVIQNGLNVYPFEKLKEETKGEFIVLVLPEAGLGKAIENLEALGLENEKDFFIIPALLTSIQGGYL